LGVTIEAPEYVYRFNYLMNVKAAVRFISIEPYIERIDPLLFEPFAESIDLIILGGESYGSVVPKEWVVEMREFCADKQIPFFFKQWGGNVKIDGAWGGNALDGRIHQELPKR
jgi:protein gp37